MRIRSLAFLLVAVGAIFTAPVIAQEQKHPVTGTITFDHYPHFGSSYYYGSQDRNYKLAKESYKKYGRNKGRVVGTITGMLVGALAEDRDGRYDAMAVGGLIGGLIGQELGYDENKMGPVVPTFRSDQKIQPVNLKQQELQKTNFQKALKQGKPDLEALAKTAE